MMISLALYSIAGLGLFALAAKYGMATAPLDYHRSIVEQDGTVSPGTQRVIEALYRVWAATLAGFGLCLLSLRKSPALDLLGFLAGKSLLTFDLGTSGL